MGVVYYCEYAHQLIHRSEHICLSAIYYQVDSVTKALHFKENYTIKLKPDPTFLHAGDLILLSNFTKPWILVCVPENQPFLMEYSAYRVIKRRTFCKCSFSAGPTLSGANNVVIPNQCNSDSQFVLALIMCLTKFSNYLKAHYHISPKPHKEQTLMLLTSDIPAYELQGLNVKIPKKPVNRRILDRESGQIYGELKHILTCMLNNHDTEFYRDEEEFQWSKRDLITYVTETTNWQKVVFIHSMLSF